MRLLIGVHCADRIVGVCEGIMRGFRNDPISAARTLVIYNGLDGLTAPVMDRGLARAALELGPDRVVIALIGYLVALKCGDVAIAAMRALPPDVAARATLLVVGDGPERAAWEAQAEGLPVLFAGQREDVHHLLRNVIDIVILPSDARGIQYRFAGGGGGGVASGWQQCRRDTEVDPGRCGWADRSGGRRGGAGRGDDDSGADPALARRYGEAARVRLRNEFNVAGFLGRFDGVYGEMTGAAPAACGVRLWRAMRVFRRQIRSHAYAGLLSGPPEESNRRT